MSALEQTPEVVYVEVMALLCTDAIDRYLGDLSRRGKAERTRTTYRRTLDEFNDTLAYRTSVREITTNDVRRYLDRFNHLSQATKAGKDSHLRGFFRWLYLEGEIKESPMEKMLPPKRQRDEDKDVLTISADDVRAMLSACKDWTEKLALGVLAYTGARLSSAANLRVSDYNQDLRKLRFEEKGSKTTWKRVPEPLALLIEQSLLEPRSLGWKLDKGRWVHRGYRKVQPDDYLIPSATSHRKVKRDNRVVSGAVRRVSERTGIAATPHSFRRAYAVHFLESFPGELETLRVNMGHTRLETTQTYLRALNRDAALERNREFDWTEKTGISEELMETVLEAEKEGFEPSIPASLGATKPSEQPGENPLLDDLVERIQQTEKEQA